MDSKKLKDRASSALKVLDMTRAVLPELDLRGTDRSATALPLALASMDTAAAIYKLLINEPEQSWVAALTLQRTQMEYVLRAAYFAKAASEDELRTFRRKGRMPKRAGRDIYIAEVAGEAADHLGWDKDKLLQSVKIHQKDLSGLVHGGKEVLAIYTRHEEWGDLTVEWDELINHVDNILIFSQLAMAVAMSFSPLDAQALDKVVRPVYVQAKRYFGDEPPSPH
jgi:hypothetical protein